MTRTAVTATITATAGALALFSGATPAMGQPGRGLTMTCPVVLRGFAADPVVYRVEGSRLVKGEAGGPVMTLSSSLRRQPLDRVRDRDGRISYSSASHRLTGPILTRKIYWTNPRGRVTRVLTETYNFRTKTIRDLSGDLQRCR